MLIVLMADSCPDFNDQYNKTNTESTVKGCVFENVAGFLLKEILNYKHNTPAHQCDDNCDHSVEVDVFIPSQYFVIESFQKCEPRPVIPGYIQTIQAILEIVPLPPQTRA